MSPVFLIAVLKFSKIGAPHLLQKSDIDFIRSPHTFDIILRAGTAPSDHNVSKSPFISVNHVPNVFQLSVANCVITGRPYKIKFCSIGNTATFHISENTLLKVSNKPFTINPRLLKTA